MTWILSVLGTIALTVTFEVLLRALVPRSWRRPDLRRRCAIVTFLLLASVAWVMALGILFTSDHLGAATRHDAAVAGVGFAVAGFVMGGFALAAAAHDGT